MTSIDDRVREQYESYPYPHRDPKDERKRLIEGSPSDLDEIRHFVFGGRLDLGRPFRALVAGGGTGDAAIMLAQHLATAGASDAEVVYLDLSTASRRIAEARATERGLANMRFVTGVLEEVGTLAPGPYDYVDCCGVLHHLASPEAGLAALAAQLAPTGGMGLMLYGTYGRSGIYPVQEALAQLVDDLPDRERLAAAHRLLAGLPASHLLNRNPLVSDHRKGKDAHLYDLLLHRRDRAYRVPELVDLLGTAGLTPLAWIEPARYAPETYLSDPMLRQRAAALPPIERAALAERLSTTISKHILYAGFADRPAVPAPDPGGDDAVLVLRDLDPAAVAKGLKPGGMLRSDIGGASYQAPLPPLTIAIVLRLDGVRTVAEVRESIAAAGIKVPDQAGFAGQVRAVFAAFHGINRMLVRHAG
ncbi:class I SAM-dependent methyltransferase [Thalassobaculum sp.]|uniref:class I SAM-dependent methyltransferase n=1 Tax=Thalassobaculum sp. TaxID=2022740 RepID=UPI0032EBC725